MKNRKLISVFLIAVLIIGACFAVTGCGSKKEEKKNEKTLEDYFKEDPAAKEEIDDMAKTMSGDQFDIDVNIAANDMIITLKLKDTYDNTLIDALKNSINDGFNDHAEDLGEKIKDLEDKAQISGVKMILVIQNGDSTEITRKEFTSADAADTEDDLEEEDDAA